AVAGFAAQDRFLDQTTRSCGITSVDDLRLELPVVAEARPSLVRAGRRRAESTIPPRRSGITAGAEGSRDPAVLRERLSRYEQANRGRALLDLATSALPY